MSLDSAFGSAEWDHRVAPVVLPPETPPASSSRSKFATIARCGNGNRLATGAAEAGTGGGNSWLRFEPFTNRQKRQWLTAAKGNGFIRLHSSTMVGNGSERRSIVLPVTETTTVRHICDKLDIDSLHVQFGGETIDRLAGSVCPLQVQNRYLRTIGYDEDHERCLLIGDSIQLQYLICFYIDRPTRRSSSDQSASASVHPHNLVVDCHVRKGRTLLSKWRRRHCRLITANGTIIIEQPDGGGDADLVLLSKYKVHMVDSRNRGKCIRLVHASSGQCILFAFDSTVDLHTWMARCSQESARVAPSSDLSNLQLEYLPDELFCVGSERLVTHINLRRNALRIRPSCGGKTMPAIGWLDDIVRLQSLRYLNIADNHLGSMPSCLMQLNALTELNISGNRLQHLPTHIRLLTNLSILNLSNNWFAELPLELSECTRLTTLDVSFNRLKHIPDVLLVLTRVTSWSLAGNDIVNIGESLDGAIINHVERIDLRRQYEMCVVMRLSSFDRLTHLSISDNGTVGEVDLAHLPSLQVLHCERMQLTSLIVNGSSLQALFASNNRLEQLQLMPIPTQLRMLYISNNRLASLPEWLTDLPSIERIYADHNLIKYLPYRMFTNVSSLRTLIVNHNELKSLPEVIENCAIEVLHVHHNRLTHLPAELLASAHRLRVLNASQNFLHSLPAVNAFSDLNKLQYLRLAANCLRDSSFGVILECRRLRLVDLSCNQLRQFDDNGCLHRLTCLEEINVSGNRLVSLPNALALLPNLQTIRAHSNCLTILPNFSQSPKLCILDIANNRFDRLHMQFCLSDQMKHLDLTCNPHMLIDSSEVLSEDERDVSLVDIGHGDAAATLAVGFSETAGERNKLCIQQVRDTVSIYALIDGGNNDEIPNALRPRLASIVAEQLELEPKNTIKALKYAIVKSHESLGEIGQKMGASLLIVHIAQQSVDNLRPRRLTCASVGDCRAILCRNGQPIALNTTDEIVTSSASEYRRLRTANAIITPNNQVNGVCKCSRLIGCSFLYPAIIPQPHTFDIELSNEDEFMILASGGVWEKLNAIEMIRRVRPIDNPQLAAKHLQDMAQAYEFAGNISIIVVRFGQQSSTAPIESFANRSVRSESLTLQHDFGHQRKQKTVDSDSACSEPAGPVVAIAKPNYYFDYKKVDRQYRTINNGDQPTSIIETTPAAVTTISSSELQCDPVNGTSMSSRVRFEHARQSLIEKLRLTTPPTKCQTYKL